MRIRERMFRQGPSAVAILVAIPFIVIGMDYDPENRAMPVTIAMVTILLCLLDIVAQEPGRIGGAVRRFFSGTTKMSAADLNPNVTPMRELGAFLWSLLLLGLAIVLGFYAAIPIYIFGYLRLYANKKTFVSLATAIGADAFIFCLFDLALGYQLFKGILFGDFL